MLADLAKPSPAMALPHISCQFIMQFLDCCCGIVMPANDSRTFMSAGVQSEQFAQAYMSNISCLKSAIRLAFNACACVKPDRQQSGES